jgi:uroporphyrinogen decarboxylase
MKREPNFDNLLAVLNRQKPCRPTLYELFLNEELHRLLTKGESFDDSDGLGECRMMARAYANAGHDYVNMLGCRLDFTVGPVTRKSSRSMNEQGVIFDRESYERYVWPDPDAFDYSRLEIIGRELPEGMKIVGFTVHGVMESVIDVMGFDNLCIMSIDDPDLLQAIFDGIGSRIMRYYQRVLEYDGVGAVLLNDDWGFTQQTVLPPEDLRRYVFPWHKRIVEMAHASGRPAMLHSCGNAARIWEDIIEDMRFDGKHSYEDKIEPVEEAYGKFSGRIGIIGGIDVDFLCRADTEEITRRAQAMLDMSADRGGYALGTGNSVPYYVPAKNYLAMIRPAVGELDI